MQRVLVMGSSGSGKSTFARRLSEMTGLPFVSLDALFWKRGWVKSDTACDVGFFIAYEFKSRMLAMLMGTMFDAAFQRFAAAFEKRADVVYGKG